MKDKIILDLCGGTGSWSKPYQNAGYNVKIITMPEYDVMTWNDFPKNVYGILAAPPCDQFSFARTNAKKKRDLKKAMEVVNGCRNIIDYYQFRIQKDTQKFSPLRFWALENPNSMLKWFLGKPWFQFNPYDFGDEYRKKTYLWGWFNAPTKNPVPCNKPKFDKLLNHEINYKGNEHLSRTVRRAITPQGFAKAFYEANK